MTKASVICEALEIAARDMYSFTTLVFFLCEKALEASRPQGVEDDDDDVIVHDVVEAFAKNPPEASMVLDRLREGFLNLFEQGL